MASTYSNLKIQLMATGENSTTWGTVTNTNLGTAIEEAISGSADVTFASANVTLTLSDTNASQTARNVRLRCTGTTGGSTRNLVVPSIEKPYIVHNDCADSVVVKTSAGTGITVPAGKTMWVYTDGTNVVDATTHLTSLTLGTALPVLSGGTGSNTASGARTNLGLGTIATQNADGVTITGGSLAGVNLTSSNVTITGGSITGITDLAVADGGTGASTASGARTNLGLGSLAVLSSVNNSNWSGTALAVANGGTGATDAATARSNLGAGTGNGTVTSVSGTGTVNGLTLTGTVTSSGSLTLGGTLSGISLTTQVTGTLPIANGGTGATTAANALTALGAYPATNPNGYTSNTGTVTSVSGTGTVNGLTLTGTVTSSGSLTLGGDITSVNASATINGVTIGYRSIPRSTTSGTATTADVGKVIAVSAGITIPNSTFAAGDAVSIYNDSASSVTITQGSGLTLRQAGTTNTGNRTLAARGMATVWFNSSSEAIISGAGVS